MKLLRKLPLVLLAFLCLRPGAHAEPADGVDMDYWYRQLCVLSQEIGCRPVGSDGEMEAMAYLRSEFAALGFSEEDDTLNHYEVLISPEGNLEAILPAGGCEEPAILIVCAHYDSAGPSEVNGVLYDVPGTRDNASGVAGMLTLARAFAAQPAFRDTEMRFLAFTAEETGHQGSLTYVEGLSPQELQRIVGVFNLDLLTVDVWLGEHVFSVDTLGMRTEDGYVSGSADAPAENRVVRAIRLAMAEQNAFDASRNGETHCVARHLGMSDHESFHAFGVDAANIAFRGNEQEGGSWHPYMHTPEDDLGNLDLVRTHQALDIVYTALSHLAADPAYGK